MAMTKPTSDQINFQNSVALPQSLTVDGTTLVVNGTTNRVGIGVAAPTTALDVAGNALITGNATITGSTAISSDLTVDTSTLKVDATNNRVGVGTASPTTTLDVSGNATISGTLSLNAGYGSAVPIFGCRAWANINGGSAGITTTFPGGLTATATRASLSNTCTITTSGAHGMTSNQVVVASTAGVLDASAVGYPITVTGSNTFTITTTATTALSAVSVTFNWQTMRASGNIHSIARVATGHYVVNINTAMPDTNYIFSGTGTRIDASEAAAICVVADRISGGTVAYKYTSAFAVLCTDNNTDVLVDCAFAYIMVVR